MLTPVPPDDCARAHEAISGRVDGELSELEGVHLDAHLAGCAACSAYALEVSVIAARLRAEPLVAPERAFTASGAYALEVGAVASRLRAELHATPAPRGFYRRRGLSVAAAAATLVVAAGSSFLAGQFVANGGGGGAGPSATGASTAAFVGRPPGVSLAAVIDGGGLVQSEIGRRTVGRAVAI